MTTLYESSGNGSALNIFRIIISIDSFSNYDYFCGSWIFLIF